MIARQAYTAILLLSLAQPAMAGLGLQALRAWWPLTDVTATTVPDGQYGRDLAHEGGITDVGGTHADFDGTAASVAYMGAADVTGEFTWYGEINPDNVSSEQGIFQLFYVGTAKLHVGAVIGSNGKFKAIASDGKEGIEVEVDVTMSPGTWYQCAFWWDGHLNARVNSTTSTAVAYSQDATVHTLAELTEREFYDGQARDWLLFADVLSSADLTTLFADQNPANWLESPADAPLELPAIFARILRRVRPR